MAKSGIAHADVGDELSKAEWLDEENHELVHGNSFPGSPTERQLFYRDDEHKWYIYNGSSWKEVTAEAGARFLALTDTPSSYSGQAGKYAKVNTGENALEFATPGGGGDMLKSTYDPDEDGVIALAQLDANVCSETEADGKITTHAGNASAHHAKTADDEVYGLLRMGLDADKPAAGTAGRFYYATDTKKLYRDTGGAWTEAILLHKARHENGGSDEISIAGLSGDPADTINKSLLTTEGDIIKRGASAPERLAIGSNGQVLTVQSGAPAWAAPSGGGGAKIQDADADTKVDVEESADEDKIRMDVGGTEVFLLDDAGILTLAKQSGASAYRNANQAISNATWTTIELNAEHFDTQNEFNTGTYRYTASVAGVYLITGQVGWDASAAGRRLQKIAKNGVSIKGTENEVVVPGAVAFACSTVPAVVELTTNDYLELRCYQTSGGALNVIADYCHLHVVKLA
jgi:hypothetical protein